jgi:hypothetical protein
MKFFKDRQAKKYGIDSSLTDKGNKTYPI